MPTVTRTQLGTLLGIAGLVSLARALTTLPFMWQQYRRQVVDMHDWAWYFLAPMATYLIYVGTGIGLLMGNGGAINGLVWASILLLVADIRNTWDMVLWFMVLKDDPSKQ